MLSLRIKEGIERLSKLAEYSPVQEAVSLNTEMKEALNRVMTLINKIRNKEVDFIEAINDTFELEKFFERFHFKTIVEVKEQSLKDLFKALSQGDKNHKIKLIELLKRLY